MGVVQYQLSKADCEKATIHLLLNKLYSDDSITNKKFKNALEQTYKKIAANTEKALYVDIKEREEIYEENEEYLEDIEKLKNWLSLQDINNKYDKNNKNDVSELLKQLKHYE